MNEEKRRIANELMLQLMPLVALNEGMTEDEGFCKKEIEKLLTINYKVIRGVETSGTRDLRVVFTHRGNRKQTRVRCEDLYNQRTNHIDISFFNGDYDEEHDKITKTSAWLFQIELKTLSHYPHNHRFDRMIQPGTEEKPKNLCKDFLRVINGKCDTLCIILDEPCYRRSVDDHYRANTSRSRKRKEPEPGKTLKHLLPEMDDLIAESRQGRGIDGRGRWYNPFTGEEHKLKYIARAFKYFGTESSILYDTEKPQAIEHLYDIGKFKCSLCDRYDSPGSGVTKGRISTHRKNDHGSVKQIYADHKVIVFIGLPSEQSK
jgi:hypothetical protein